MPALDFLPAYFYRIVLYLVHTVVRYGLLGWAFIDEFKRFYVSHPLNLKRDVSYVYIKKTSETLFRLPKHVGFVFVEDGSPDYSDLANLTVWAIAMGIPYITMYERTGKLLSDDKNVWQAIQKKLGKLLGSHSKTIDISFNREDHTKENGFVAKMFETFFGNFGKVHMQHVQVNVLSEKDGKLDLAQATRELSSRTKESSMKYSEIDVSTLGSDITALKGMPDPELILQFGEIQCLAGFLPWHIRLSEIVSIPSSKKINFDTFYKACKKYAGCQQRFGT